MAAPRFRLLGIVDDVTACDCCGKQELKCTMALEELDADGNAVGEVYYGRDCGARALGWSVSADRAERLVRGTARIDWWTLERMWQAAYPGFTFPTGPAIATLDGVSLLVWNRNHLGRAPVGWTKCDKSGTFAWKVAA